MQQGAEKGGTTNPRPRQSVPAPPGLCVRLRWRHVIINTHCSWLHGDARGFRSRSSRIHSSGDYKHRPPLGEHAGLYHHRDKQSGKEVHISRHLRPIMGSALRQYLTEVGYRVLAVAVGKVHAHLLMQLPDDMRSIRAIIGEAKRFSSCAVKQELPGIIWARNGKFEPVDSYSHQKNAYRYILYDQGAGAWSFRDQSDDGQLGRTRGDG